MIEWENRQYDCIERLNLREGIIGLENFKGGSYFTVLPISPPNYRKNHPTKYNLSHKSKKGISIFEIVDDWGEIRILRITEIPENMPFIEKNKSYVNEENVNEKI